MDRRMAASVAGCLGRTDGASRARCARAATAGDAGGVRVGGERTSGGSAGAACGSRQGRGIGKRGVGFMLDCYIYTWASDSWAFLTGSLHFGSSTGTYGGDLKPAPTSPVSGPRTHKPGGKIWTRPCPAGFETHGFRVQTRPAAISRSFGCVRLSVMEY